MNTTAGPAHHGGMSDTDHDLAALPDIGALPAPTLHRVGELGRSLRADSPTDIFV